MSLVIVWSTIWMTKSTLTKLTRAAALIASGAVLAACGGGGGGGSSPAPTFVLPPPPPASQSPSWTQGVFEPASAFKDQCAVPRTGVDIEGNPFSDVQGELLDELFWLRSWSDETYLWNDEIVDQDPARFNNRLDYFEEL